MILTNCNYIKSFSSFQSQNKWYPTLIINSTKSTQLLYQKACNGKRKINEQDGSKNKGKK